MDAGIALETSSEVLSAVTKRLGELVDSGVDSPVDVAEARELSKSVEALVRQVESVRVAVLDALDSTDAITEDGHGTAQTFHAHHGRLAPATTHRLGRRRRYRRLMPRFDEAVAANLIGPEFADRVARALIKPVRRDGIAACDDVLTREAQRLHFEDFSRFVSRLEEHADPDGTRDRDARAQANRDVKVVQDFDKSWTFDGKLASLDGLEVSEIHSKFVDEEFRVDLEDARQRLGEEFSMDQLQRTPAQRRADAFVAMARAAAAAGVGAVGSEVVVNVMMDQATFERELARLAGADVVDPTALEAAETGLRPSARGIDGQPLDAVQCTVEALLGHVRRVVIGSDGVTIDLGRKQRLFTGSARLAAMLANPDGCFVGGCLRPPSRCEVDHLVEWHEGGGTDQHNGGMGCGPHNRWKHRHRIRVRRTPDGTWRLTHPDGRIIE